MTDPSQTLSRCLKVFLLVALLYCFYPLSDDSPSSSKHFVIKVEARIEHMADVHPYISQFDVQNGPAEILGRFRRTAGSGDSVSRQGWWLNTKRDTTKLYHTDIHSEWMESSTCHSRADGKTKLLNICRITHGICNIRYSIICENSQTNMQYSDYEIVPS